MIPERNLNSPLRRMVDERGVTAVLKELTEIVDELNSPLRRMVDERGVTAVLKELTEIVDELDAGGEWRGVSNNLERAHILSREVEAQLESEV
jgi:exonuclease VII small subunit